MAKLLSSSATCPAALESLHYISKKCAVHLVQQSVIEPIFDLMCKLDRLAVRIVFEILKHDHDPSLLHDKDRLKRFLGALMKHPNFHTKERFDTCFIRIACRLAKRIRYFPDILDWVMDQVKTCSNKEYALVSLWIVASYCSERDWLEKLLDHLKGDLANLSLQILFALDLKWKCKPSPDFVMSLPVSSALKLKWIKTFLVQQPLKPLQLNIERLYLDMTAFQFYELGVLLSHTGYPDYAYQIFEKLYQNMLSGPFKNGMQFSAAMALAEKDVKVGQYDSKPFYDALNALLTCSLSTHKQAFHSQYILLQALMTDTMYRIHQELQLLNVHRIIINLEKCFKDCLMLRRSFIDMDEHSRDILLAQSLFCKHMLSLISKASGRGGYEQVMSKNVIYYDSASCSGYDVSQSLK